MNIPNPNPLPADPAPKSKLRKCACLLLVLFLLAGSAFLAIWYFGSQSPHASSGHPLHSAFDSSPAHSKLLGQLAKGRLSVVVGAREEGLLEFGEHLANVLSQKGPVFFENYSPEHFELFQIVREAKTAINQLLKIELTLAADWVLLSAQGDPIPPDVLQKIQARNPKAKVVIFTTKPQKIKGYKEFAYPALKTDLVRAAIQQKLQLSATAATILTDYFQTTEKTYLGLGASSFDLKDFLGDSYRSLQNVTSAAAGILKTLCGKGAARGKQEQQGLSDLGVIYHQGNYHWSSHEARLNYELGRDVDCKDIIAAEEVLKAVEVAKQQELERKAREEEKRREEEERKAREEEERRLEDERRLQEIKEEEERKKQEEIEKAQAKAAKLAKKEKAEQKAKEAAAKAEAKKEQKEAKKEEKEKKKEVKEEKKEAKAEEKKAKAEVKAAEKSTKESKTVSGKTEKSQAAPSKPSKAPQPKAKKESTK